VVKRKSSWENSTWHCGNCREAGHNVRTCQNESKPPKPPVKSKLKRNRKSRPGNISGLQHGFYSPRFLKGEIAMLDLMEQYKDVSSEIKLVQVAMGRAIKMMTADINIEKTISLLNVITIGVAKLTHMKKIQKLLFGQGETLSDFLEPALAEVIEEFEREGEQMKIQRVIGKKENG